MQLKNCLDLIATEAVVLSALLFIASSLLLANALGASVVAMSVIGVAATLFQFVVGIITVKIMGENFFKDIKPEEAGVLNSILRTKMPAILGDTELLGDLLSGLFLVVSSGIFGYPLLYASSISGLIAFTAISGLIPVVTALGIYVNYKINGKSEIEVTHCANCHHSMKKKNKKVESALTHEASEKVESALTHEASEKVESALTHEASEKVASTLIHEASADTYDDELCRQILPLVDR